MAKTTRIFYIPGFGEKANIFEKIAPHIQSTGNIFLDNWELLGDTPRKETDVLQYAKELIAKYNIISSDVIIGHSLGGWIAYHIKQVVNCRIVQIASFTNPALIISPFSNLKVIHFLVKSGLYFNRFTMQHFLKKDYAGKPSRNIFIETFKRVENGNKNNVMNQLRLIYKPVPAERKIVPDLRIHAKGDPLVHIPKEAFHETSGDHFTLYTNPKEVYLPIVNWLNSEY